VTSVPTAARATLAPSTDRVDRAAKGNSPAKQCPNEESCATRVHPPYNPHGRGARRRARATGRVGARPDGRPHCAWSARG
jgi:hypothetical protein